MSIRTTKELLVKLAFEEGLMVEKITFLFIFGSLTSSEARCPPDLGPLFHFFRSNSILGSGNICRCVGGFGSSGRLGWREIIVVWSAVILGSGQIRCKFGKWPMPIGF